LLVTPFIITEGRSYLKRKIIKIKYNMCYGSCHYEDFEGECTIAGNRQTPNDATCMKAYLSDQIVEAAENGNDIYPSDPRKYADDVD
jgi:hypothetical protein